MSYNVSPSLSDLLHSVWHSLSLPCYCKWHYFILFNGWVIFHCMYVPYLLDPFHCRRTFRLRGSFLILFNSCISFHYLYICTYHINRCFKFLAILNNTAIRMCDFYQVQVYLKDECSIVDRSAETDVSTPVILIVVQLLVVSNSLWPHGLQHTRLPCPSLSLRTGNFGKYYQLTSTAPQLVN